MEAALPQPALPVQPVFGERGIRESVAVHARPRKPVRPVHPSPQLPLPVDGH